jgi:hypothetical protein
MKSKFKPPFNYRDSIGGPIRGQSRGVLLNDPTLDANRARFALVPPPTTGLPAATSFNSPASFAQSISAMLKAHRHDVQGS